MTGDWAKETWIQLAGLAKRSVYCFDNVDAFEECRPYWAALMYLLIAAGIVVVLIMCSHFLSYHLKRRSVMRRRLEEAKIAPDDVMREVRWNGDDALDPGLSAAEIASRIRAEKERIKAGAPNPKDPSKGDPNMGIDVLHR